MKSPLNIFRIPTSVFLLALPGFFFILTPAQAQQASVQQGPTTALSDVSGPFLGNVQTDTIPLAPPLTVSTSITSLDTSARDMLLSPPQLNLGEVMKICLRVTASMDKLSPFSGCSNVNWKAYNRAVQDAKALGHELSKSVQTQKLALKSNPTPPQQADILKRLELLEKTTAALESTNNTLVALGQAMDKAR